MTFELKQTFLSLVRLGSGHRSALFDVDDWQAIKALADKQGLTAIVADGIEKLPDTVFQNYENRYKLYQRAIAELASWYTPTGIR